MVLNPAHKCLYNLYIAYIISQLSFLCHTSSNSVNLFYTSWTKIWLMFCHLLYVLNIYLPFITILLSFMSLCVCVCKPSCPHSSVLDVLLHNFCITVSITVLWIPWDWVPYLHIFYILRDIDHELPNARHSMNG